MRCIFCKSDSSTSKSKEHIIPESLGNKEHILPPGIVCDSCNNYFALKLEKPLLESEYFVHTRHRNDVSNKKGRLPTITATHVQSATSIELGKEEDGLFVFASRERDTARFIKSLQESQKGTILFPVVSEPQDGQILSRFVGKVALEALASRVLNSSGELKEIIDKPELDLLRNDARRGKRNFVWPLHQRRLYGEDKVFFEEGFGHYEVLHEYTFLYTEAQELFFVLAIFGIEYAINLGGPTVEGYKAWLEQNNGKSALYM